MDSLLDGMGKVMHEWEGQIVRLRPVSDSNNRRLNVIVSCV